MITTLVREYATNFVNHISTNFERRTTDYFFVRFNDESDGGFWEVFLWPADVNSQNTPMKKLQLARANGPPFVTILLNKL